MRVAEEAPGGRGPAGDDEPGGGVGERGRGRGRGEAERRRPPFVILFLFFAFRFAAAAALSTFFFVFFLVAVVVVKGLPADDVAPEPPGPGTLPHWRAPAAVGRRGVSGNGRRASGKGEDLAERRPPSSAFLCH